MSAPQPVQLDEQRLTARVCFRAENFTGETWMPEDGFAAGYQIFDPDTGTLIRDGARAPLPRALAPGEFVDLELRVDLPSEPGRYRVVVSTLQEAVAWHFEHGQPFLAIETEVTAGRARLTGTALMTQGELRRRNFFRALGRAFTYPCTLIGRHHSLIRSMVRRDIVGRYRGSFGGVFWTVLNPLLLMATYFFVFGIVLHARFGHDQSRTGYVLYFLCGMLPWLAFSEALGRSATVILEYRNFVKKLVFPLETLPVNLVIAGLVTEAFALAIFTVGIFAVRGGVPTAVLWLPALLVPQVLLTAGLSWFLAALGVYVRDLGQVNGFLLTLWFFLTPICYPVESLPAPALGILSKNPMFTLVGGYRDVFLEGRRPDLGPLAILLVLSAVMFFAGHAWFYKLRRNFADVI